MNGYDNHYEFVLAHMLAEESFRLKMRNKIAAEIFQAEEKRILVDMLNQETYSLFEIYKVNKNSCVYALDLMQWFDRHRLTFKNEEKQESVSQLKLEDFLTPKEKSHVKTKAFEDLEKAFYEDDPSIFAVSRDNFLHLVNEFKPEATDE